MKSRFSGVPDSALSRKSDRSGEYRNIPTKKNGGIKSAKKDNGRVVKKE